jgi:hypothetical protein
MYDTRAYFHTKDVGSSAAARFRHVKEKPRQAKAVGVLANMAGELRMLIQDMKA